MWKRSWAAVLVLATTAALAAAQDYQIVKVASVADAAADGLKPKTILFTDHRTDDKSDKGAFIHFEEWTRTKPDEAKFLNLFPGFKEGMVQSDVAFYSGHGRYGSGPDFDRNFTTELLDEHGGIEQIFDDYEQLEAKLKEEGKPFGRSA